MCMRGVSVKGLWDDTQDLQFVNLHAELVERLVSYHVLLCQQRIGCMETTLVVDLQGPHWLLSRDTCVVCTEWS